MESADVISENTYNRLAGDEAGLLAYYPFETKQRNANNIIETVPSFMNKVDSVFAVYSKDVITVKDAPSLKDYSELTNVRYSFVASDNKIVLNIDETDDKIEGCNLYIAVSGVRDANNNPANPISWNAYVNINALKWNQESTAIVTESLKEKSFDVTISNNGSDIEAWSLSNVPSWLSVSETSGSLKPLYEKVLTFTVNSFASIGKYEETMYLTGNKNISEPFVVALNVTGERPDWAINPTDYEYSMNMIAQLKIVDVISQDEDDLIAAFIGEECIGLASPEYYNRYDSYYTLMDIYGNSSMLNSNVNFKVWDASTGNIYPLTKTSQTVTFADNALAGSFETPVEVNASDMIEQRIALKKGWNWTSIIVEDKDDMSINSMMGNIVNSSIIIKDKSTFSVPADGQWTGLLTTVAPGQMYKVKMSQTDNLTPIGKQVVPAEVVITVKSGWNWLGFTPSQNMSLNDALGALNPTTGDIVKGQTGFSTYNGYE